MREPVCEIASGRDRWGTCLVVSNTLLMAIAERTREIGILTALGWTPWLVLRMPLAESLVLCAMNHPAPLLAVKGLSRHHDGGAVKALDGTTFDARAGEVWRSPAPAVAARAPCCL